MLARGHSGVLGQATWEGSVSLVVRARAVAWMAMLCLCGYPAAGVRGELRHADSGVGGPPERATLPGKFLCGLQCGWC